MLNISVQKQIGASCHTFLLYRSTHNLKPEKKVLKNRQIIHATGHLTENLTVTAYIRDIAYYLLSYSYIALVALQYMVWKCNCTSQKEKVASLTNLPFSYICL